MLIIVMVIAWFLVNLLSKNEHKNTSVDMTKTKKNVSNVIKDYVLNIYHSDITDKRETIVKLLHRLTDYEDPGEFLENHGYIHDYIFNVYKYERMN